MLGLCSKVSWALVAFVLSTSTALLLVGGVPLLFVAGRFLVSGIWVFLAASLACVRCLLKPAASFFLELCTDVTQTTTTTTSQINFDMHYDSSVPSGDSTGRWNVYRAAEAAVLSSIATLFSARHVVPIGR